MKKTILLSLTIVTLLNTTPIFANSPKQAINVPVTKKAEMQIKTQNMGVETNLNVTTQASMEANIANTKKITNTVSEKIEKVIKVTDEVSKIGPKVKEIATQQEQAQKTIKTQLNKLEERKGLLRTLLGPDQDSLTQLRLQVQNNEDRIDSLNKLKTTITNETIKQEIDSFIQTLKDQNTTLLNQIKIEETTPSILGWLMKLFN